MKYNPMRSTHQSRWIIKKYEEEPLDYGIDLRDLVKKNHWLILKSYPNEVQVRCPECGYFMQISITKKQPYDNHTISEDGIIMPSVGHISCGFHEWAKLENFSI